MKRVGAERAHRGTHRVLLRRDDRGRSDRCRHNCHTHGGLSSKSQSPNPKAQSRNPNFQLSTWDLGGRRATVASRVRDVKSKATEAAHTEGTETIEFCILCE